LDFLGLKDVYSEKDLEAAILRDLERFLLELGVDFSFIARPRRITVDREHRALLDDNGNTLGALKKFDAGRQVSGAGH
jgi:hypothetical protein